MGLFSTPKCPIHGIVYKIDKDYLCQPYYFCPKCRKKAMSDKSKDSLIKDLKNRIIVLESQKNKNQAPVASATGANSIISKKEKKDENTRRNFSKI